MPSDKVKCYETVMMCHPYCKTEQGLYKCFMKENEHHTNRSAFIRIFFDFAIR
jgi:hypothetical protein